MLKVSLALLLALGLLVQVDGASACIFLPLGDNFDKIPKRLESKGDVIAVVSVKGDKRNRKSDRCTTLNGGEAADLRECAEKAFDLEIRSVRKGNLQSALEAVFLDPLPFDICEWDRANSMMGQRLHAAQVLWPVKIAVYLKLREFQGKPFYQITGAYVLAK